MMIISSWQWSQVATTEYLQNTPFGNAMDGAVLRTEFTCPSLNNYETGWPSIWMGDNGVSMKAVLVSTGENLDYGVKVTLH